MTKRSRYAASMAAGPGGSSPVWYGAIHDSGQGVPELGDASFTERVVEPYVVCVDDGRARGQQLASARGETVELRAPVRGVGTKLEVAMLDQVAGEFRGRLFGATTALDEGGE